MSATIVDISLIVISILLMWGGWRHGFIRAAGSLLGLIISIGVSIWGVTWLENVTGLNLTSNPVVFVVVFLTLAIFVNQLVRFVVGALDLVRRFISIIPFVGLINRVLGLLLGVVQVVILVGAMAYVTVTYIPAGGLQTALRHSRFVSTGIRAEEQLGVL